MTAHATPVDFRRTRRPDAPRSTATDLLRCLGLSEYASAETAAIPVALRDVPPDTALLHEGQPMEWLHVVAAGSFKAVQVDAEGYEQVLGFAIRGDVVGLDGLGSARHASSAIALESSTVMGLPFDELVRLGRHLPVFELLLHRAAGAELQARAQTQYLMSAPSSEVRVARFLLQFARRLHALDHPAQPMRLCMTRRDIASHLGIAHETVSRALSGLAQTGCLHVANRSIEILDAGALEDLQRITRGAPRGRPSRPLRERLARVA
jgi:CRP/FNR family transcriptional regulator, anaerobic regulatory protein